MPPAPAMDLDGHGRRPAATPAGASGSGLPFSVSGSSCSSPCYVCCFYCAVASRNPADTPPRLHRAHSSGGR